MGFRDIYNLMDIVMFDIEFYFDCVDLVEHMTHELPFNGDYSDPFQELKKTLKAAEDRLRFYPINWF